MRRPGRQAKAPAPPLARRALILVAVSSALAQTAPAPPPLTLKDAEALAIKNHPQVQAAQLNYQASQQAVACLLYTSPSPRD